MTYSSEVLADSPLAYYRLGDASGTTMTDSSGNGRNGTYNGPTLGATGLLTGDANTSADFDGTNDRCTVTYNAGWMAPANWTIEAWFNTDTTSGAAVIAGRQASGNARWSITRSGTGLVFRFNSNGSSGWNDLTVASVVTTGQTYHVVGTWDGTTRRLYLNGSQIGSDTPGFTPSGTAGLSIGSWFDLSAEWFNGRIDEVAYYGTALSSTRVGAHYTAGITPPGVVNGGLATETDEALAGTVTVDTVITGGLATETDTALAGTVSEGVVISGSQAQETDAALPGSVTVDTTVAGGLATETDTALGGTVVGPTVVSGGQAQETDTALAGTVVQSPHTNLNISDADDLDGIVTWAWEPPIEPPPVTAPPADKIHARAYTGFEHAALGAPPAMTDLQMAERDRARTRILVAGRDVTFWRGMATPEPIYSLVSPLLYGSGSITFPQVHASFEQIGTGALHWLKPFASVVIQRLNDAGEVAGVSYRGFLLKATIDGKALTFGLAGEATGRANLVDRQPRIIRRRNDLGYWWYALMRELRLPVAPKVDTGIVLQNAGGMSTTEYVAHLSAKGVGRSGNQWTTMPNAAGEYVTARKNRTTKHATVYFDDANTVPLLERDPSEEPNRIFVTAVSPSGRRIRFAVYPVLQEVRAITYPMDDGSSFGEGTTNEDTDTGDGVTVMIARLAQVGYLSQELRPGGFDGDVTNALKELQDDAGLAQTGNMNLNTWAALYDIDIHGYDTGGAKILPAVQSPKVRQFDRTAAGLIRGINPDWDPTVLPVDRTIDMGVGHTENEAREFARQVLVDATQPNWVGTVTFNTGALIEGEHTPGDPLTAADIWDARELQPGMNIWAPLFGGTEATPGTLLHVSAVDVGRDGAGRPLITATVDTRARDTMEVWQVIQRNRESRRDPGRMWIRSHRSSSIHNDALNEWDSMGGQIQDTPLKGGQWNQVGFVGGQAGTVARLRLRVDEPCEYVACLTGRQIPTTRLDLRIGNPLTAAGTERWTDQDIQDDLDENWFMLYVAGDDSQPLGYWPKRKGAAGASLTGLWKDDAGVSYFTFDDCSLYLSIFPAQDCTLQGGRIAWNQLETGT